MRGRQHIWPALIKRLYVTLVVLVVGFGAAADTGGPRQVVARLNAALLEAMQGADSLGYAGRYALLEPVLRDSFDFPLMTRIAVGRTWGDLSDGQRATLIDLFARMSIANFAARFDGYAGERFEIVAETPGPRDAIVIESDLVRPADEPIALNYVLREFDDGWRIIDVLLDSKFSELARQRSEFAAVLAKGGLPRLVATLEQKIARLAEEG